MGLLNSFRIGLRHWLSGRSLVRIIGTGYFKSDSSACISRSKIYIYPGASLIIGKNCNIKGVTISVTKGCCHIDNYTIIDGSLLSIDKGELKIGHHSKISCKRIWIRFGGTLTIGDYTNINEGSELRCDEFLSIGSYNQISYNVRIWDTNTHSKLSKEQRRNITEARFPYFGFEESQPDTAPVKIGDDCWIGEKAAIMKGSCIGDGSIIGFDTLICGKEIPSECRVVNERPLKISNIN